MESLGSCVWPALVGEPVELIEIGLDVGDTGDAVGRRVVGKLAGLG